MSERFLVVTNKSGKNLKQINGRYKNKVNAYTVTSRLFTHIVSTEKMRKDLRDHKDMRGTNYTYYISYFLILLLKKSRLGTFPFLTTCLLYL